MWSIDLTRTGSRLALLSGQFIILLICIGTIQFIYSGDINPDKRAKETFQETHCFLVSKKLSTRGHFIRTYRADFLINYNVNGVQYNRWVSGNGLDASFTRNQAEQKNILSQYQAGSSYLCHSDPKNPQKTLLILRHNWLSIFPLILPSVITIIVLYYFLKNLLLLSGRIRLKTPTVVRKKKHRLKHKKK